MNTLKTVLTWFVRSSANPQNVSLTLKGALAFLVVFGLNASDITQIEDALSVAIIGTGYVVSSLITLYGFARKLHNTFK